MKISLHKSHKFLALIKKELNSTGYMLPVTASIRVIKEKSYTQLSNELKEKLKESENQIAVNDKLTLTLIDIKAAIFVANHESGISALLFKIQRVNAEIRSAKNCIVTSSAETLNVLKTRVDASEVDRGSTICTVPTLDQESVKEVIKVSKRKLNELEEQLTKLNYETKIDIELDPIVAEVLGLD